VVHRRRGAVRGERRRPVFVAIKVIKVVVAMATVMVFAGTAPATSPPTPPISRGYCGFARKCARRFRAQHASVLSWHIGHSSP